MNESQVGVTLLEASEQIHSFNAELDEILVLFKNEMTGIKNLWHSDAADIIAANVAGIRFEDYYNTVEKYVNFLKTVGEGIGNINVVIKGNAETVISNVVAGNSYSAELK